MSARWIVHNLVAHPLLILCPPLGCWLHDRTAPTDIGASRCYLQEDDPPGAHPLEEGVVCARCYGALVDESTLVAELRAARAENEKLRSACRDALDALTMDDNSQAQRPRGPIVRAHLERALAAAAVGLEEETEATKMNQRKGAIT